MTENQDTPPVLSVPQEPQTFRASLQELEQKIAALNEERALVSQEYEKIRHEITETDTTGADLRAKLARLDEHEKTLREEKKALEKRLDEITKGLQKVQDVERKLKQ